MDNQILSVNKLSKLYSDRAGLSIKLFDNVSFECMPKEISCVLAPRGAGKSSLLKIIAGLEEPTSGEITPDKHSIIYIPGKPSSFPWLSVHDNIIYGLKNPDAKNVKDVIEIIGLEGYEAHIPDNDSIGFRFRISLGMAIIRNPNYILLDEPFDGMNSETKVEIFSLIKKINNKKNIAFLLATSEVAEALKLSDKIIIMSKLPGKVTDEIKVQMTFDDEKRDEFAPEFISMKNEIEKKFIGFNPH